MAKRKLKQKRQAMIAKAREQRHSSFESSIDSDSNAPRFASPRGSLLVKTNSPPRVVLPPCTSASPNVPAPPCAAKKANPAVLTPLFSEVPTLPPTPLGAAGFGNAAKDAHLPLSIPMSFTPNKHSSISVAFDHTSNTNKKNVYNTSNSDSVLTNKNCNYQRSVQGSFHQGNESMFGRNVGKQCTAMSFIALTYKQMKPVAEWSSNDLDKILIEGDKLYSTLKARNTGGHTFIDVHELPEQFNAFGLNFKYNYHDRMSIVLDASNEDLIEYDSYSLLEALNIVFDSATACFITFNDYTFVMAKSKSTYFAFDSHARNENGCQDNQGASVMVEIDSISEAHSYCYALFNSIRGNQTIRGCEITGVNIIIEKDRLGIYAAKRNEIPDLSILHQESTEALRFEPLDEHMQIKLCKMLGVPVIKYLRLKSNESLQLSIHTQSIHADGNCFFRAISFALSGSEQYHYAIREKVVYHMANNPRKFQSVLRSGYVDITDYLQKSMMLQSGVWVTELEILATADYLNTDIYTLHNSSWLKHSAKQIDGSAIPSKCSIYVKNQNNNHYDFVLGMVPLIPITDNRVCFNENEMIRAKKTSKGTYAITFELVDSKNKSHTVVNNSANINNVRKRKRKRQAYSTGLQKNKNRKRLKRLSSQTPKGTSEPQITPELTSNVSFYKKNAPYRNRKKMAKNAKYKSDRLFRNNILEYDKVKYRTDDVYRKKKISYGKHKYKTNDVYREERIGFGINKYKTDDIFRQERIRFGRNKYKTDAIFRQERMRFGRNKYKNDDIFRQKKIRFGINKYKTDVIFRQKRINYVTNKYRTNAGYRNQLRLRMKAASKHKYSSDTGYRAHKIKTGKQVYLQNENKKIEVEMRNTSKKIIVEFRKECIKGPEYVCCSCHRLLFKKQVLLCNEITYKKKGDIIKHVADKCISKQYLHTCNNSCNDDCSRITQRGKLWICHTCHRKILHGCVPAESVANNLNLETVPHCLESLNHLEQHLIALHIPFMKILALPKGGQKGVNGPVVCVPADIEETTNILPRSDGNDLLLEVKLKRKLSYRGYYKYETINQKHLENALSYLIGNNFWYSDVSLNEDWSNPLPDENVNSYEATDNAHGTKINVDGNCSSIDRNDESEERSSGLQLGSCLQPYDIGQHVLDEYFDEAMNLAPSEKYNPVDVLQESGNEAKTFPVHFPSGFGTFSDGRDIRITLSRYFNNRLMNANNRFARDVNYIFYCQYMTELQHVMSSVSIACRKSSAKTCDGTEISAEMLKDGCTLQDLLKSDQIYKFLTPIRGTPPYWQTAQKDLFAMIRQLGIPTWFCSFSSADMRWKEITNTILIQQNDNRKAEELNWEEKCDILRSNPVTVARMFDYRFHTFLNQVILSTMAPIGKVRDYFYRVEFQKRGSPHVHCLFWVENAPKFNDDADDKVTEFIDKYVTCRVPNETEDAELKEIVTNVQQHSKKHSMTCKKRGTKCRFNFPRPPSTRTFIARSNAEDEKDNYSLNEAKQTIQKLWKAVLENESENLTCQQLLEQAEMSQGTLEEAFGTVSHRNDIVLKRELNETWTNQYNETLLKCWNANMDIQFVLDAFACVVYVISYISKAEHEMGLLLRQTKKEAEEDNLDAQKTMRKLGSTYLKCREISAQEAVYRVCNLRLKECSRKVQFIPVGENPVRLRVPLKYLSSENENIWMSSIHDKYQARPASENFETMCLAIFCSEYRILAKSQVPKNMRNNDEQQNESGTIQKLQNNMGYIQKRTRTDPAVIRYARFSESKSPEMYYQSILQLFLPHRLMTQLKPHGFETYENFYQTGFVKMMTTKCLKSVKSIVDSNHKIFDTNGEIIQDAQERMNNIDLEDAWAKLCPESEVERDECKNGAVTTVQNHEENDDITLDFNASNNIPTHKERNKNLYTKTEVYPLLQNMNIKQSAVFYKVRQWCLDTIHGKRPKPFHLFITGGAGTGKSHLIKCIYYEATRLFTQISNPEDTTVLLTAPTGTAAFNIKGRTCHSALSIPINMGDDYQQLGEEKLNTLRSTLSNLQILIIDEVSLVNKRQLFWISERLMQIKKSKGCFGNVSIIVVGDFYQLPPVAMPSGYSLYNEKLSFPVNVFLDNFYVVELDQVMRQKDDLTFANMLNRCRVKRRNDSIALEDLTMLKQCCGRNNDNALHICPRNNQVNDFNDEMLAKTCINITSFPAEDFRKDKRNGRLVRRATPYDEKTAKTNLPSILKVAENARVMLVRNIDVEDGLVNGVIGSIVKIMTNQILVLFDNERVGKKACKQQHFDDVPANAVGILPIEEHLDVIDGAVRKQFPLRLAWACTVHKVQGLTLDEIVVTLDRVFASGQAYVAFSRVKTQSGLFITDTYDANVLEKVIYCDEEISDVIENMPKFLTNSEDMTETHTKLILHNIEGLYSNLASIRSDKRFLNADYLCLTETWLTGKTLNDGTEDLENFLFFNTPRILSYDTSHESFESLKKQQKGGVGIFVRKDKQFYPHDLSLPNLEYYSFAAIDNILVTVLYRPNTYPLNLFLNTLEALVNKCLHYTRSIIMGDFNQDILASSSIQQLMETRGYSQLVRNVTTQYGTLLDHVYVRGITNISVDVIPTYYSYHEAIVIKLNTDLQL